MNINEPSFRRSAGSLAAAVTLVEGCSLELAELRSWAAGRLSSYKIPKRLLVVSDFPRNAMGKVMKPAVKELFGRWSDATGSRPGRGRS